MKKLFSTILVLGLLLASCTAMDFVNFGSGVISELIKDPTPKKDKK